MQFIEKLTHIYAIVIVVLCVVGMVMPTGTSGEERAQILVRLTHALYGFTMMVYVLWILP